MKHVIFDVDGTLIDTAQSLLSALQYTVLQETGKEYTLDQLLFTFGIPGVEGLARLGVADPPAALEKWEQNIPQFRHTDRVFPGMIQMLETLRSHGYQLGVVTSRTNKQMDRDFYDFGIHPYFSHIVTADDTLRHKPTGEPLRHYAKVAGIDLADMVYIGDSAHDFGCATDAGVRFLLARWGTRQPIPAPEQPATPLEALELLLNTF